MAAPRKRVPLWVWLTAGFFAFWLGGLAYIFYLRQNIPSTGDELLDYVLLHMDKQGALSPEELMQIESRFVDDPRTGDLLALTGMSELQLADYCKDALDRGKPVSGNLLSLYIDQKETGWYGEWPHPEQKPISRKLSKDEKLSTWINKDRKISALIDSKYGAERDELYRLLKKLDPDTSNTWNLIAQLHFEREEYAPAIAALEKANKAEYNQANSYFPIDRYRHDIRLGGRLASNPRAGTLAKQAQYYMPNFIQRKYLAYGLFDLSLRENDRHAMQVLHDYGCRVGQMEDGQGLAPLVAVVIVKHEVERVWAKGGLSKEQQRELTVLKGLLDKIKTETKNINSNTPTEQLLRQITPVAALRLQLFGEDLDSLQHKDNLYLQREFNQRVFPLLDQVAAFDWAEFYELRDSSD